MLQNIYTLPDLIDLALKVPEIGAVNFNILHTILQTLVKQMRLTDIRPWCHIENPIVAKAALTKAKLLDESFGKSLSDEYLSHQPQKIQFRPSISKSASMDQVSELMDIKETLPPPKETKKHFEQDKAELEERDSALKLLSEEGTKTDKEAPDSQSSEDATTDSTTRRDSSVQVDPESLEFQDKGSTDSAVKAPPDDEEKQVPVPAQVVIDDTLAPVEIVKEVLVKETVQELKKAGAAWQITNLGSRVEATEEGLHRISNIVDLIVDKIKKAEARKKAGGPSSEELEAIDDRLLELEEAKARADADHERLLEMDKLLGDLLRDFAFIKSLGDQLKQMQIDISKKADKEETWAYIATKGDLELVNTKVDQLEFETAIEELGEAIGLLGIKFQQKRAEWEDRAAELWKGIDSKMSFDVFEAARIKIEARLTALMFGMKKLKKVVEDLLYPDSSGVTRCIACRRPAGVSGKENFDASPKRPLTPSDASSEDPDEKEKLRKEIDEVIAKRPKLDGPPYCSSRSTIISVPYSSASYRSSLSESESKSTAHFKIELAPSTRRENIDASERVSQVPKLPDIKEVQSPSHARSTRKAKAKGQARPRHAELVFTNKLLAEIKRREGEEDKITGTTYTAVLELKPSRSKKTLSARSLPASLDVMGDSVSNVQAFAPVRLMQDPRRREILLSPPVLQQYKPAMRLSPIPSDSESKHGSSSTKSMDNT